MYRQGHNQQSTFHTVLSTILYIYFPVTGKLHKYFLITQTFSEWYTPILQVNNINFFQKIEELKIM